MHTQNSVLIKGDLRSIFSLAAQVERWPEILPHYRRVDILQSGVSDRLVGMHCVRSFGPFGWPCRWKATQTVLPEENRILFKHVAGPVRGMDVEWKLQASEDGVQTSIRHDLEARSPIAKIYLSFVGPVFVSAVAGQTLSKIKELVERGERA